MPPLDRTIPFAHIDNISIPISHNLDLYMPRRLAVFLYIHLSIPKRSLCFILCSMKCIAETRRCMDKFHTPAAAAGSGPYHDGETNLAGNIHCIFLIFNPCAAPWKDCYPYLLGPSANSMRLMGNKIQA